MTDIRAFVGHSFTDEDDLVVRTFLEYFDEVQKLEHGFSWDHAKAAEAKDLAEKVLMKMQDKNLFIGICTKKERVIGDQELKPPFWPRKQLAAAEGSFEWKTSDWITQEIGLAIGRGMELMILLEKGVRRPGGLQGNHEYIVFERDAPEKAFKQILQTLRSLMPKMNVIASEAKKPDAEREPTELNDTGQGEASWLEPKADWPRRRYELAFLHAVADEDAVEEEKIDKAFLASAHSQELGAPVSWEAVKERLRIMFGKGGKLITLEQLAITHQQNSEVHRNLGLAYRAYDQHRRAAEQFDLAAEVADSLESKFGCYGEAVLSLIDSGETARARGQIEKIKVLARDIQNGQQLLIGILRQAAEKQENNDAVFGLYEFLLQLAPDDVDSRFSLAYRYSKNAFEDLSLFHYLKINYPDRSSATWNNLGVQFDHFDLVVKAVEAYRKSEALGETLAMGNLAYKLLNAGFIREAEELCNKALQIENCDKRVSQALTRVKEVPSEEAKKQEEIAAQVVQVSKFFGDFGRALLDEVVSEHEGRWQGPDCELKITIRNGKFNAVGEFQRDGLGALANALMGIYATTTPSVPRRFSVTYKGDLDGRTVKGVMQREELGKAAPPPTLSGSISNEVKVLMVISDSLQYISVCERVDSKERTFKELQFIG